MRAIEKRKMTPQERYDKKNRRIFTLGMYITKDKRLIDVLEAAPSRAARLKELAYKGLDAEEQEAKH